MKRIPDLPQEELHFYAGIRGSFSFPIPLGIECGPLRQLEVEEMPHPLATKRLLEMRQFGLSFWDMQLKQKMLFSSAKALTRERGRKDCRKHAKLRRT